MYPFPPSICIASAHTALAPAPASSEQRNERTKRHLHCAITRVKDDSRAVSPADVASIARTTDGIHVRPRCRDLGVHVGDLALHKLERPDRLAELLALVDVGESDLRSGVSQQSSSGKRRERTSKAACMSPKGPPARTSRSRSRPDMRTPAPPLRGPRTFSSGTSQSSKTSCCVNVSAT